MLSFDEFAIAAKKIENITGCTVEKDGDCVQIIVESYLANDDGSMVERARTPVEMTTEQYAEKRFSTPGSWLLAACERAIADKYQGFTRYATADEVAVAQSKLAQEGSAST